MNETTKFHSMLAATVLSCLMASTVVRAEPITDAKLEDDGQTLLITIGSAETQFTAPKGKFWAHVVLAGNKQKAFVALQRGSRTKGWFHEDIHEFSVAEFAAAPKTYKLRAISLVSDLEDASIQEVFSASHDGSRLLVSVHYSYYRGARETLYRWYPYFFDTHTGKVAIVTP